MSYKVNLPSALREVIEQVSMEMHNDPLHHLLPSQRLRIYRVFDTMVENPSHVNKIRGNLGILNAQYVLPIWEQVSPIWNSQALFEEAHRQLSPEHLQDLQDRYIIGDHNLLPQRWIALGQNVLQGLEKPEAVSQEVHNLWDFPSGIRSEFLDQKDMLSTPYFVCKAPYVLLQRAYYACDAAFKALQEIIGRSFLDEVDELDHINDDNFATAYRDSASSAVVAYAGGADTTMIGHPNKHLAFWEWWLNEAIPKAYE